MTSPLRGISIGRDHSGSVIRDDGRATSALVYLDGAAAASAPLRLRSLSDFEDFFAPLYPSLVHCSWLVDGADFSFPDDREPGFLADVLAHYENCRYFRDGSLRRWARYLVDDWCEIVGFGSIARDPRAMVHACAGRLSDEGILALTPHPEVVFRCVDGVRWSLYAHHEALLTIARDHAMSLGGIRVSNVDLGYDL